MYHVRYCCTCRYYAIPHALLLLCILDPGNTSIYPTCTLRLLYNFELVPASTCTRTSTAAGRPAFSLLYGTCTSRCATRDAGRTNAAILRVQIHAMNRFLPYKEGLVGGVVSATMLCAQPTAGVKLRTHLYSYTHFELITVATHLPILWRCCCSPTLICV